MPDDIILTLTYDNDLSAVEGRTFQVHLLPGNRIRLYPVTLPEADGRCPAFIKGEQCGREAGHGGKHCWARGD